MKCVTPPKWEVCLVGGSATPLKNMKVNWDDDIPNISGKIKSMATKPPTSCCWEGIALQVSALTLRSRRKTRDRRDTQLSSLTEILNAASRVLPHRERADVFSAPRDWSDFKTGLPNRQIEPLLGLFSFWVQLVMRQTCETKNYWDRTWKEKLHLTISKTSVCSSII